VRVAFYTLVFWLYFGLACLAGKLAWDTRSWGFIPLIAGPLVMMVLTDYRLHRWKNSSKPSPR
jgi:hypothetical protein